MTLNDIVCFLNVAETGSYTEAARKTGITQPAVSKHIASLEQEYDVVLIDRTNRRSISLTEAGKILYEALKKGQNAFENARRKIKALCEYEQVILNLPKAVALPKDLVRRYNDFAISILPAHVTIDQWEYAGLIAALDRGELAICEEEAIPTERRYRKYKLTKEPVPHILVASSEHQRAPNSFPEDFIGSPVLLYNTMPPLLLEKYLSYLTGLYGAKPKIIYFNNIHDVYLYLQSGQSITLNTGWLGFANSHEMYTVKLPIATDYYLVWNHDTVNSTMLDKMMEFLK